MASREGGTEGAGRRDSTGGAGHGGRRSGEGGTGPDKGLQVLPVVATQPWADH